MSSFLEIRFSDFLLRMGRIFFLFQAWQNIYQKITMLHLTYQNLFDFLYGIQNQTQKIGNLELAKINVQESRNCYWRISLGDGTVLTVKQRNLYSRNFTNYDLEKEYKLDNFFDSCDGLADLTSLLPTFVNFEQNSSILIYQYPATYSTLKSFDIVSTNFPELIAKNLGETIARLHRQTSQSQECCNFLKEDQIYYDIPYPAYILEQFEVENFSTFPAEGFKFLAFYQRYENLKSAVQSLIINHRRCCLTHNNLKFNKILLSQNNSESAEIIKLIDWENSSWGDPAFDLGTVLAGYLQIWLNSLTINPAIELQESLKLAGIPLEMLRPSIIAMLQAYLKSYPKVLEDDPNFIPRVIQFSGLAIIYEIIFRIESHQDFGNREICMLQVAKNLLCKPSQSLESILAVTQAELINDKISAINQKRSS